MSHPRQVLLGAQAATGLLPVCDHYSGVEARMLKSLALQREMTEEFGRCVFDVTLDCEDGAPAGAEDSHSKMVVGLANKAFSAHKNIAFENSAKAPRIAARVHPVDHPAFQNDIKTLVDGAGEVWCHLMIPKAETVADIDFAVKAVDQAAAQSKHAAKRNAPIPLHALIESANAVHNAFAIAAHPRIQSLSFGMMDFVSSHGGAIPASALDVVSSGGKLGQFEHPLITRAKLEISSACHASGKVPAHSVITEFSDMSAMKTAALRASREFGFTRMWSIHPSQIRPILEALAPGSEEIEEAADIVVAAEKAQWAPINAAGRLHDRASYRYYWQVLERAGQTGRPMPVSVQKYFSTQTV
jgi:citrate lyase subunit beta / citryl-CoA lyase